MDDGHGQHFEWKMGIDNFLRECQTLTYNMDNDACALLPGYCSPNFAGKCSVSCTLGSDGKKLKSNTNTFALSMRKILTYRRIHYLKIQLIKSNY
jgi:hypothetical protein